MCILWGCILLRLKSDCEPIGVTSLEIMPMRLLGCLTLKGMGVFSWRTNSWIEVGCNVLIIRVTALLSHLFHIFTSCGIFISDELLDEGREIILTDFESMFWSLDVLNFRMIYISIVVIVLFADVAVHTFWTGFGNQLNKHFFTSSDFS